MQAAIDRVMHTYGMIQPMTQQESDHIRQQVTEHLSGRTDEDENRLAVEGLRFVRQLRQERA